MMKTLLYWCVWRTKMAAKYDPDGEAEVISWFKQLFNVDLQAGMREMENQLRDGQLLVRYQPSIVLSSVWTIAAINLPRRLL